MPWVVVIPAAAMGVYGILNVVAPATTIRWQRASTARGSEGSMHRRVGARFASTLASPGRVRVIGIYEIAMAALIIAVALR